VTNYFHRSLDAGGKTVSGLVSALSVEEAADQLIREGLAPVEVVEGKGSLWTRLNVSVDLFGAPTKRNVHSLTRDLARLTRAGLTLERALALTADTSESEVMGEIISNLQADVRKGKSFAAALDNESELFPSYYVAAVNAAESAGRLPEALASLEEMLGRQLSFTEKVRSTLIYPSILLVMVVATLLLVVVVVLPQFGPLFNEAGDKLPVVTRVVMKFGDLVREFGAYLLLFLVLALGTLFRYFRSDSVRLKLGEWLIGNWMATAPDVIRTMRTLGGSASGGVHLDAGIRMSAATATNPVIRDDILAIAESVRRGISLSKELELRPWATPLLIQMVRVGEETGRLGAMLEETANIMEESYRLRLERLLNLIGPLLTLVMAGIVATVIGSVLIGMMSISQLVL
jgi:general secretion pathway protein F